MKVKRFQIILAAFLIGIVGLTGLVLFKMPGEVFLKAARTSNQFSNNGYNLNDYGNFSLEGYFNENQKFIDILHYDLNLDLDLEEELLKGEVELTGKILMNSLKEINLNFHDNMEIESIELNGEKADYENSGTDLVVSRNNDLPEFIIKIVYSGSPRQLGFGSFNFRDFNGRPTVYTLSEPNYASTWFPCNDLPTDKALFDIKITSDSEYTSISNGILIDVKENNDKKTFHWKTQYPASTYLVSINTGHYENFSEKYLSISGDSLLLDYYVFPEDLSKAKIDFEDHKDYLEVFEEMFGHYPFVKEKYGIAEFMWGSGAMEHQTITGLSYNLITGRKFFADILIHELAHHWWGNAVGPATWKDIWLNEGFAKYSEALYWEKKKGLNSLKSVMQSLYGDFNDGTLYDPGSNLFGIKIYNKGAWVLHMLRKEIGDKAFFQSIKNYYEKFKYDNASTEDLKLVCEEVSEKDLDHFFDQWLYEGIGIIILRYNWDYEKLGDGYKVNLKLRQTQDGYEKYIFPLDVLVENEKNTEVNKYYISSTDTTLSFISKLEPGNLELDPDGWLLAHIWEEQE